MLWRFSLSSARILLCSLSGRAYFHVGITERMHPIAGGMDTMKNRIIMNGSYSGFSLGMPPAAIKSLTS